LLHNITKLAKHGIPDGSFHFTKKAHGAQVEQMFGWLGLPVPWPEDWD
jgi:hypothetical protein